jgi:hypothetical protein
MNQIFTIAIMVLLVFVTHPVNAQQTADAPSTAQLEDMGQFYKDCHADPRYQQSYDCRCLSVLFYDDIQKRGTYDRNEVISELPLNQCPRTDETDMKDRMSEIPTEYLEEAEAFNTRCQTIHAYATHHDCDCLSTKYLDERIKQGKFVHASLLELEISKSCINKDTAAGYSYKTCMSQSVSFPLGQDPENYCECVANTYASLFAASGASYSSKSRTQFQVKAAIQCR